MKGHRLRSREEVRKILLDRSIIDGDGCWLWQGAESEGYGLISAKSLTGSYAPIRTHVATWILYRGDRPEGSHVHHTCEKKNCVNPSHLVLLTARDHIQLHNPVVENECRYGHYGRIRYYQSNRPGGHRVCLECEAARKRRKRIELRNSR